MPEMMHGLYIGNVVDTKLSEEAKIGVKLRDIMGDVTFQAQVSGFLAGKQYGSLFLPEEGDQVLVAFLKGSLENPVIIGSIWSKKNEVPDQNKDGKNNLKIIKTRGGNEIRLSDEDGMEKIDFKTKGGNEICLNNEKDKERIEFVSGEAKVTIEKNENKITIESTGEISITGKVVTIEAKENMKIKGKTVNIEAADGNAEIKANVVNVEAKDKMIKLDADVSVTGTLEVGTVLKTLIKDNTITGIKNG